MTEVAADSAATSAEVAVSPASQRDRAVKLEATSEGRGSPRDSVSVPTLDKRDKKVKNKSDKKVKNKSDKKAKNKSDKKDPKEKQVRRSEVKPEIDSDDL